MSNLKYKVLTLRQRQIAPSRCLPLSSGLDIRQERLRVALQGIYLGNLRYTDNTEQYYIGSSYGQNDPNQRFGDGPGMLSF